jgi:hypothetical protein
MEVGDIDWGAVMEIAIIVYICIKVLRVIWRIMMAIDQTHEKYVKITPLSHVFTGMSILSIICSITRKSLEQQHTQNITHTHFEHHTRNT